MAFDVQPIKRRTSGMAVGEDDVLAYLQREVAPELKSIRTLIDLMSSAGLESSASVSNSVGLSTDGKRTVFSHIHKASIQPSMRLTFDPGQHPVVNLAKTRSVDVEYWLDADKNVGSPEVALFNASTNVEISGTRVLHTGGTVSARYVATNISVGDEADEMPDEETTFYLKARDVDNLAIMTVLQARILVRYV